MNCSSGAKTIVPSDQNVIIALRNLRIQKQRYRRLKQHPMRQTFVLVVLVSDVGRDEYIVGKLRRLCHGFRDLCLGAHYWPDFAFAPSVHQECLGGMSGAV